jgi:hypothetical protein
MSTKNAILIGLAVLAGMFFLYALSVPRGTPTEYGNASQTEQSASAFEQQTNSEGTAEVVVQPLDLGSSTWTFNFGINTHMGSLDMDILKIVTLTDDRGDTIVPIAWNGPGTGGHHRNGTLTFPAPSSTPKSITVTVTGVGGVATRTFSWNLP